MAARKQVQSAAVRVVALWLFTSTLCSAQDGYDVDHVDGYDDVTDMDDGYDDGWNDMEDELGTCDGGDCGGGKKKAVKEEPLEVLIWDRAVDTDRAPEFPYSDILLAEEVSKITRTRSERNKWAKNMAHCGWTEFYTAWDNNGDVIVVSLENFFRDDLVEKIRKRALKAKWERADIHKSKLAGQESDPRKGNGFPGFRVDAEPQVSDDIIDCLRPVLKRIDPELLFPGDLEEVQTLYGLVDWKLQPGKVWLDSQRLPHNDIKWNYGVVRDNAKSIPVSYASVYPLTKAFNDSGTSLFLEKESGFSLLKTLPMNERAQGNSNPHHDGRLHPELDLYEEIPDPHPHSMAAQRDNAWVKMIMVAYLRYNRFILYDGRRLHNQYFTPEQYTRLTGDPNSGRLTMNSFFWTRA